MAGKKGEKLPVKASARPGVALFVEKLSDSGSLKKAHKPQTYNSTFGFGP